MIDKVEVKSEYYKKEFNQQKYFLHAENATQYLEDTLGGNIFKL